MANNTLDKAIAAIPEFGKRIKLFSEKLRIAQYADCSIYDYRLKIAQAVLFTNKLPEEFTQTDIDYYLSTLLGKDRCSLTFFKHTVFGLKAYYNVMGYKEPKGLVLPRVRKPKRLPRVLSQEQMLVVLGSNLFYHPHIHCIVPGGGMDKLGVWHHLNGCEKSNFLFPVHGMSDKFRGRFMALLTRKLKEEGIVIFNYIRDLCFDKDWVVYSRPPATGVNQVLEYIARYA